MTRRLLGYVVKLADGTRHGSTPRPGRLTSVIWEEGDPVGSYLVPVFAVPKRPKPATVDAGERYACLVDNGGGEFLFSSVQDVGDFGCEVGSREEAAAAARNHPRGAKVVRVLDDGAHEATVAAAVMAERERVLGALAASVEKERAAASADSDKWPAASAFAGAFDQVLTMIEAAKVTP